MTISEALRHQMYERFVAVFGTEVGDALMEHPPPTGWADVATKRDVDHLEASTKRDLEMVRVELRGEMAELRGELLRSMASQTRVLILAMFGMMATSIGSVVSVAALVH